MSAQPTISPADAASLKAQAFWGNFTILPVAASIIASLKFLRRYKMRDIKELRRQYAEITRDGQPTLICPNHLTLIDSIVLHWAFGSVSWYVFNFRCFSWNVPAIENFKQKLGRRIITYLGKCIAIDRWGDRAHLDGVLGRINYLLKSGHPVTVFPEGTRSRTGRIEVENTTYGVGQMVFDCPGTRVLCVYVRGDKQDQYSDLPPKGSEFTVNMELIEPTTEETKARRAQRELAVQIINKLKSLEDQYFQEHEPEESSSRE